MNTTYAVSELVLTELPDMSDQMIKRLEHTAEMLDTSCFHIWELADLHDNGARADWCIKCEITQEIHNGERKVLF